MKSSVMTVIVMGAAKPAPEPKPEPKRNESEIDHKAHHPQEKR
jgi:hypothetical protein